MQITYIIQKSRRRSISVSIVADNNVLVKAPYGTTERTVQEFLPSEVLDSVVVHELCHRRHMNHSKEFYAEIDQVFPEYKRWNKWLKDNGGVYLKRCGKK
ncbi:putative metal-dependent hydrolase [Treponema rectale]|uniref:Putative metal-dependent hydrolase n=1 Tax=Treponema rectale TaxID=744512 RepID=A0A840SKC5_9SPIR|nr:M48 family metallopeptidase [Treponema rectale]MBB5219801.1 putative metal-dependent hydrolase [Treponema rectale]